jgi:hypothetical protein
MQLKVCKRVKSNSNKETDMIAAVKARESDPNAEQLFTSDKVVDTLTHHKKRRDQARSRGADLKPKRRRQDGHPPAKQRLSN